jgi:hypothetical protein
MPRPNPKPPPLRSLEITLVVTGLAIITNAALPVQELLAFAVATQAYRLRPR